MVMGACFITVNMLLWLLCIVSAVFFFFMRVGQITPSCCLFFCFCLFCPLPRRSFLSFYGVVQVQFRQIGPGMVQQLQSACSVCRGEGKMINERDKCKTCAAKKVRRQNQYNKRNEGSRFDVAI